MSTTAITDKTSFIGEFTQKRWFRRLTPMSEKPSFVPRLFAIDLGLTLLVFIVGSIVGSVFLAKGSSTTTVTEKVNSTIAEKLNFEEDVTTNGYRSNESYSKSQIIIFDRTEGLNDPKRLLSAPVASPGTLIRAKVLNKLEVVGAAPAFAQIIDHGLGRQFFGSTIIGEAAANPQNGRLQFSWNLLKPERPKNIAHEIEGITLSLNGTLGIVAKVNSGFGERVGIATAKGGAVDYNSSTTKISVPVLLKMYCLGRCFAALGLNLIET